MVGTSHGRHDRPGIRHRLSATTSSRSCSARPTRRQGRSVSRMFADVGRHGAGSSGVPFVMRDVTLWAFTLPFFETREAELQEFEAAMAVMHAADRRLPRAAELHPDARHQRPARSGIKVPTLVIAGEEDILIPVALSKRLHEGIAGSEWTTTPGGHACHLGTPRAVQPGRTGVHRTPTLTDSRQIGVRDDMRTSIRRTDATVAVRRPDGPSALFGAAVTRRVHAHDRGAGRRSGSRPARGHVEGGPDRRTGHPRPRDLDHLHRRAGLREHLQQAHRHRREQRVLPRARDLMDSRTTTRPGPSTSSTTRPSTTAKASRPRM